MAGPSRWLVLLVAAALLVAACATDDSTAVGGVTVTTEVNSPIASAAVATEPPAPVAETTTTNEPPPPTTRPTTTTTTTTTTTQPKAPAVEGDPAADFTVVLDDGAVFALAEQYNPVLLFFWATWCEKCHQLMPGVDQIAADYDGDLSVIAVARDSTIVDIEHDVIEYLPSGSTRWLLDEDYALSQGYAIPGVPVSILVVGEVEVARWLGPVDDVEIRDCLDEFLAMYDA